MVAVKVGDEYAGETRQAHFVAAHLYLRPFAAVYHIEFFMHIHYLCALQVAH